MSATERADSDRYPWVADLDQVWHLRPRGRGWHLDRADGAQAETLCGRWVPSVHVSEFKPEDVSLAVCEVCGPRWDTRAAAVGGPSMERSDG